MKVTSFVFLVFGFYFLTGCQPQYKKESRFLMGTIVEVSSNDERAFDIAFGEIERIENLLTKFKPDSEISQLNKNGVLSASPDTIDIINNSLEFYNASEGAFDITVAPLLDIWGFSDKNFRIPTDQEISRALGLVGSDKLMINNHRVSFAAAGMKIDLGAVAPGYAVDKAIEKLTQAGIKSALVNGGGEIRALGLKNGRPWKIAVQNPKGKGYVDYFDLENKAVATSGDYEQFFEADGRRFSHIFDPTNGRPAESDVVAVTVIADDCLTADALSTIIFVLGERRGRQIAQSYNAQVITIPKDT